MVEFRWIKIPLFLIVVLLFTVAPGHQLFSFIVRNGDEVTLPCENAISDQHQCGSTTWNFNHFIIHDTVELIQLGQIKNDSAKSKSDRLTVTPECSLVIKKVTYEDVGLYTCRQYISGQKHGKDTQVYLSFINITEHEDTDKVTLSCSVFTTNTNNKTKTSNINKINIKCNNHIHLRRHNNLELNALKTVEMIVDYRKNPAPPTPITLCDAPVDTVEHFRFLGTIITRDFNHHTLHYIHSLTTTVVVVVVRNKGHKTPADDSIALSLDSAAKQSNPETQQDMTDPEDDVAYASIGHKMKTNGKAQVNDDEGGAVTYATVKVSSSAGASADPSDLYATVNKKIK
ncbi:hypothetical protein LDENG_00046360 [Lucifuga dentata]|nr:hypothetical protein LDENG_00046360 [Lucifuga dentata]